MYLEVCPLPGLPIYRANGREGVQNAHVMRAREKTVKDGPVNELKFSRSSPHFTS